MMILLRHLNWVSYHDFSIYTYYITPSIIEALKLTLLIRTPF